MTKKVRITNADTSDFKVRARLFNVGDNHETAEPLEQHVATYAGDAVEVLIHDGVFAVIDEG